MCVSLLNGPEEACGLFSNGGSESILLAVLAYREAAKAADRQPPYEIICASTAHPALAKACFYFGLQLVVLPVGRDSQRLEPAAVAAALTPRTAAVYASAPCFSCGVAMAVGDAANLLIPSRRLSCPNTQQNGWGSIGSKNGTLPDPFPPTFVSRGERPEGRGFGIIFITCTRGHPTGCRSDRGARSAGEQGGGRPPRGQLPGWVLSDARPAGWAAPPHRMGLRRAGRDLDLNRCAQVRDVCQGCLRLRLPRP